LDAEHPNNNEMRAAPDASLAMALLSRNLPEATQPALPGCKHAKKCSPDAAAQSNIARVLT